MSNLVGHRLGKYELASLLGRGGMADVYGAYQPGLERTVAIKVLQGYGADSPELIARFKREARSVALLRHTNIVQVFDFDVENDLYYMVMEYIKGGTLGSYIRSDGALSPDDALSLAIQLADALSYAHQRGVIHRDIKPANIMFTDGEHRHPVITDFGIAYILNDPVILTAAGRPVGSPAYLSPEVARGEQADERSDIYSFGVTLYEMVTGRIPFSATTSDDFVIQHINTPPPAPRRFNANLPPDLEAILLKTLAKRRDQRFQSAIELKIALQQVQDALAGRLDPIQSYPISNQQPRNSRSALAPAGQQADHGTLILNAPTSVNGLSSPIDYGRNPSRTMELIGADQPQRPNRRRRFILLLLGLVATCFGLFFVQTKLLSIGVGNGIGGNANSEITATATPTTQPTDGPKSNAQRPIQHPDILIDGLATGSATPPTATATPDTTLTLVIEADFTPTRGTPTISPTPTRITRTPTLTLTPSLTATRRPTNPPATNVPQATPVPPTNVPVQPTSLPVQPTSVPVQPTNPPPQPTSVPPPQPTSAPPPQPTNPPIIPPIIPTLVCKLLCG